MFEDLEGVNQCRLSRSVLPIDAEDATGRIRLLPLRQINRAMAHIFEAPKGNAEGGSEES